MKLSRDVEWRIAEFQLFIYRKHGIDVSRYSIIDIICSEFNINKDNITIDHIDKIQLQMTYRHKNEMLRWINCIKRRTCGTFNEDIIDEIREQFPYVKEPKYERVIPSISEDIIQRDINMSKENYNFQSFS